MVRQRNSAVPALRHQHWWVRAESRAQGLAAVDAHLLAVGKDQSLEPDDLLAVRKLVWMSDLREIVTGLGMQDVRSLFQSGNLVFRGGARSFTQVERALEDALR